MKTKLIDLLGLTNMANDIRDWVNAKFQRKVDGKGLSTNDYDATAKSKVDAIPDNPQYTDTTYEAGDGISIENNVISATGGGGGGEENVIEAITMNNASVPVTNKTAEITETDPTVPSWAKQPNKPSYNYSEIGNTPDLSGFITKSVNDLTNYYLKSETYTKTEVAALIGAIQQFHYEIYASLPASGESNVLYLIGPTGSGADRYEEYVYSNSTFNKIGDTSIDLSGYVTTSALNTALAGYCPMFVSEGENYIGGWEEGGCRYIIGADGLVYAIGEANAFGAEDLVLATTNYVNNAIEGLADVATSGSYNDLTNKPTIPTVPTNVSAFTNDAGYLTQHQSLTDYVQKSQTAGLIKNDGTVDTTQYGTYSKSSGGIPASDLASGVIPTVPVQDVTVGGTSVVNNGTAVIPAIPSTSDFEASANKVSTIAGNETSTTKYPSTKAVADALGKWGVVSQTQTWSGTGTQPRTYVMSDQVYGTIPQANIDLFESAGATFNATTGYFELNGLTDISYEEMNKIYSLPHLTPVANTWSGLYNNEIVVKARTIIPMRTNSAVSSLGTASIASMFLSSSAFETIVFNISSDGLNRNSIPAQACNYTFSGCQRLRDIDELVATSTVNNQNFTSAFNKCYSLENIRLRRLGKDVSFEHSSLLNLSSIVYMVENAVNTSAITITLHADALAKCTADTTEYTYNGNTYTGIVALATAKNITLAS